MPKVKLKLQDSLHTHAFQDAGQLFQQRAFERLYQILSNICHDRNTYQNKKCEHVSDCRIHNNIYIDGVRGTGKTNFILNIESYLSSSARNNNDPKRQELVRNIAFFKPLDPTVLDPKENLLSSITAHLTNHPNLDKILDNYSSPGNLSGYGQDTPNQIQIDAYYHSLEILGASIDGLHGGDPLTGLERISEQYDSLALEQRLHEFFSTLTQLLGVKILLLPIDDIDLAANHGFQVLNIIRRSLASPLLVPVITGNFDVYNQLLNKNIQEWFGIPEDKRPYHDLNQTQKKMIDDIREGFYSKVFPLHNRISLDKIDTLIENDQLEIEVESRADNGSGNSIPARLLDEVATRLTRLNINLRHTQDQNYLRYFSRSTRDYIHLLFSLRDTLIITTRIFHNLTTKHPSAVISRENEIAICYLKENGYTLNDNKLLDDLKSYDSQQMPRIGHPTSLMGDLIALILINSTHSESAETNKPESEWFRLLDTLATQVNTLSMDTHVQGLDPFLRHLRNDRRHTSVDGRFHHLNCLNEILDTPLAELLHDCGIPVEKSKKRQIEISRHPWEEYIIDNRFRSIPTAPPDAEKDLETIFLDGLFFIDQSTLTIADKQVFSVIKFLRLIFMSMDQEFSVDSLATLILDDPYHYGTRGREIRWLKRSDISAYIDENKFHNKVNEWRKEHITPHPRFDDYKIRLLIINFHLFLKKAIPTLQEKTSHTGQTISLIHLARASARSLVTTLEAIETNNALPIYADISELRLMMRQDKPQPPTHDRDILSFVVALSRHPLIALIETYSPKGIQPVLKRPLESVPAILADLYKMLPPLAHDRRSGVPNMESLRKALAEIEEQLNIEWPKLEVGEKNYIADMMLDDASPLRIYINEAQAYKMHNSLKGIFKLLNRDMPI